MKSQFPKKSKKVAGERLKIIIAVGFLFLGLILIIRAFFISKQIENVSEKYKRNAPINSNMDTGENIQYNARISPYPSPASLRSVKKGGEVYKSKLVKVRFRKPTTDKDQNTKNPDVSIEEPSSEKQTSSEHPEDKKPLKHFSGM